MSPMALAAARPRRRALAPPLLLLLAAPLAAALEGGGDDAEGCLEQDLAGGSKTPVLLLQRPNTAVLQPPADGTRAAAGGPAAPVTGGGAAPPSRPAKSLAGMASSSHGHADGRARAWPRMPPRPGQRRHAWHGNLTAGGRRGRGGLLAPARRLLPILWGVIAGMGLFVFLFLVRNSLNWAKITKREAKGFNFLSDGYLTEEHYAERQRRILDTLRKECCQGR